VIDGAVITETVDTSHPIALKFTGIAVGRLRAFFGYPTTHNRGIPVFAAKPLDDAIYRITAVEWGRTRTRAASGHRDRGHTK
jgi:hypothetical protein